MVSQDKFIIHFQSKVVPLVISIESAINGYGSLFKINEFEKIRIELERNFSETKIYIQDRNGELQLIEEEFVVEANQYIPGYILFRIEKKGVYYNRFFEVLPPNSVGKLGLFQIRKIIESISPGLSFEFNDSFLQNIVVGDLIENIIKIKCGFLKSKYNVIQKHLTMILQNPIIELKKEITREHFSKKQNVKTIIKNVYHSNNNQKYNIKTVENYSCSENAMLYFILINIKRHIVTINNLFLKSFVDIEKIINEFENKLQYGNIKHFHSLIEKYKDMKEKNLKIYKTNEELLLKINTVIVELELEKNPLSMKRITPKFLNNYSYNGIYEIYKVLNAENVNLIFDFSDNKQFVNYKSTPVLFELYNYVLIKDILLNNGYKSISLNEEQKSFTSVFVSDSKRVEVIFGADVPMIDNAANYYGLISITSNKTTPDIVVNVYDSENNIIKSSIVEVKCRLFKYIYDNNITNEVLYQLRNYYQFRFKSKEAKKIDRKFSIDNVVCTYPYDSENEYLYDHFEEIHYIGLELQKDYKRTKGYLLLESIIL